MKPIAAHLKPLLDAIEANLEKKRVSPYHCHHCRDSGFIHEILNNEPVARKCQACNGALWKWKAEQPRKPVTEDYENPED